MKWLVTIQQDDTKTITFEVEAQRLTWTGGVAIFDYLGKAEPVFAIGSFRLVKVENVENAA